MNRFAKDLGRFTGLKFCCVLGGESMERQFAAIHSNPDVLFATPGRFVHLCLEMGLKLDSDSPHLDDEDPWHPEVIAEEVRSRANHGI